VWPRHGAWPCRGEGSLCLAARTKRASSDLHDVGSGMLGARAEPLDAAASRQPRASVRIPNPLVGAAAIKPSRSRGFHVTTCCRRELRSPLTCTFAGNWQPGVIRGVARVDLVHGRAPGAQLVLGSGLVDMNCKIQDRNDVLATMLADDGTCSMRW
jgi:hypothetical protein